MFTEEAFRGGDSCSLLAQDDKRRTRVRAIHTSLTKSGENGETAVAPGKGHAAFTRASFVSWGTKRFSSSGNDCSRQTFHLPDADQCARTSTPPYPPLPLTMPNIFPPDSDKIPARYRLHSAPVLRVYTRQSTCAAAAGGYWGNVDSQFQTLMGASLIAFSSQWGVNSRSGTGGALRR